MHVRPFKNQGPSAKIQLGAFGQIPRRDLRPLGGNQGLTENIVTYLLTYLLMVLIDYILEGLSIFWVGNIVSCIGMPRKAK